MSNDEAYRQASCVGKARYATPGLAQRVAERARGYGRTHRKRSAYPCSFCGGWHVGNPLKKKTRPAR